MKKYHVFLWLGTMGPIKKYSTDDLSRARNMRNLLAEEDEEHEYVVMSNITEEPQKYELPE